MDKVQMILDTLVTPLDLDYSQGRGTYMVAPNHPQPWMFRRHIRQCVNNVHGYSLLSNQQQSKY